MPVMVSVFAGVSGHLFNWHYTAFQIAAAGVLELDGGVGNLKMRF
jgi:hypothetical protein